MCLNISTNGLWPPEQYNHTTYTLLISVRLTQSKYEVVWYAAWALLWASAESKENIQVIM